MGLPNVRLFSESAFWTLINADFADLKKKNLRLSAFISVP